MRPNCPRHCSYVLSVDAAASADELQVLAAHLSTLGVAGCEVIVLDPAPPEALEARRRILRWVARHVAASGDVVQAAVGAASTDKIIIAAPDSRYTADEISAICNMLDRYEAVEPEEFVEPMPWWGAIDAGRLLLQRGLEKPPGRGRTFAFRRSAWRPLLAPDMQPVGDVFVRHEPPRFATWLRSRAGEALRSRTLPVETAVFACMLPLLVILGVLGGIELAGGYAGVLACASVLIALRGRSGARDRFPLRACLFAPLAIIERSLAVYYALFRMRRGVDELAADEIIGSHASTVSDRHPLHRPPSVR